METFDNRQRYRHGISIKIGVVKIIDELETVRRYGYTSNELTPHSDKPIVAVCDRCHFTRAVRKNGYHELCRSCAAKTRVPMSEEHKQNISKALEGKYSGENSPWFGKKHTEESKRKISATKQGIDVSEWESFALEHSYCYLFDDDCRERNRYRYGRRCFICGKPESENFTRAGKQKKLAVHHVDMNKQQGCEDPEWSLVPLCIEHHNPAHTELWRARIEYLLQNVYTDGKWRTWVQ